MSDRVALEEASAVLAAAGLGASEAQALAEAAGTDGDLLALARARAAGAPLAHLTGRHRFLTLDLAIAPGVLVPRPETELLARIAIEVLRAAAADGHEVRFLDLCCGAGNLVCAIAAHLPAARGWACDLTSPAVELTRCNVERLGLSGRVQVLQGDLLAPLAGLGLESGLDAVVCNPPYISTGRLGRDRASLLDHEPREAFDGGPYGLSIHQRVVREAAAFLRPGAPAMLEVGEGQERQVVLLLKRARIWEGAETRLDVNGVPRVIVARRKAG
jgi:release factor glutamine methyltransferase